MFSEKEEKETFSTPLYDEKSESAQKKVIKGSEALIRSLIEENVHYIFGYPGGAIMPVYDSLYDFSDQLTHILTRHEQGAIHAAQGFARVTGKVGICFATSGPGATNLLTGLADAYIDSTPIVCITGQVAQHLIGTDAFQETDVVGITMPVTKWNHQIIKAEDIPKAVAKAFFIAKSGRPGPVLIDIAKNAQIAECEFSYKKHERVRSYTVKPKIQIEKVREAAELIDKAKRPLALVGQGIILGKAEEELKKFLEKTGVPAAWTLLGLSALSTNHPLNVGMLGMHGNYAPNLLTNESDVIIGIGMRFDDRVTGDTSRYANQAKIIHMEIDKSEVDKNIKSHVAIVGNVKDSLPVLTGFVKHNTHKAWLERFKELDEIEYKKVIESDLHPKKPDLTMGEVVNVISEKSKHDAILVTDVGQHQMAAARYFKFKRSKSNVTSGGLGTMGFALPAALGAKIGNQDRTVVAIIGDGGFQMTLQELATIEQTGAAVKIVILNNNFLGMVRQWQQIFFEKRYSFVELKNPNFVKLSESFGIKSAKLESREMLEQSVEDMLAHDGPYLLEVIVEKEENVFPMVPTGASVSEILLEPPKK